MHVVAIINPISGAGADERAARRRMSLLRDELDRRGLTADIHLTTHAGHAYTLAADAVQRDVRLVVVWGGDGTVNEAGAALAGSGVAMGLVPAGSGNGLAAALRIPRDPRRAIGTALDGGTRRIDAGVLAGRPFFNIAGIGVDARIAAEFNRRAKGSRGRWPYIRIGVRQAWTYDAREYDLDLDGWSGRVRAILIGFANGPEYGNGVCLASHALPDDGLLDAVVVEDRGAAARFWDARRLLRTDVADAPRVLARRVRRALVHAPGAVDYHVDGEPGLTEGPVEVTIRPGALLVRA